MAPNALASGRHVRSVAHSPAGAPSARVSGYKLDHELTRRSNGRTSLNTSPVIVSLQPGAQLPPEFAKYVRNDKIGIINGIVLNLPDSLLATVASLPSVFRVHHDRPTRKDDFRTNVTVGATLVQDRLGYTGAGVGVAVIDSGITSWHDDLTSFTQKQYPYGNQRVTKFVDFVNQRSLPYDDNGHGSHVTGIITGNGYDSDGLQSGVAPGTSIVSLKVLDENGKGAVSNIIRALDWVAVNHKQYNIRIVNLSVGAGVFESYWTDPLTLATKTLTDMGIVVVAAAGNLGQNANGQLQWGGITAPGNAPWVLTVGASSTMGTLTRKDDTLAAYSSSGPTYIDYLAKPDLVAPGTGTVSFSAPGSLFYSTKASALLNGTRTLGYKPYLSLSGTSMAAPVVSGTVALMLQANPHLTPNLVKAILQYTAQQYPGYSALREGAGFLNSFGAVTLAKFYVRPRRDDRVPTEAGWSKQIIWGNHQLSGGVLNPKANAWTSNVVWGAVKTLADGDDNIVWGTACADCDNVVWGTAADDNVVWGTSGGDDNVVWGTANGDDNVVWGTANGDDNVVWGTDCGGEDCDNVVWGTADETDNVVWGTADGNDNVIWGTGGDDNVVWGTADDDNVVWGTASPLDVIFPDVTNAPVPNIELELRQPLLPSRSILQIGGR